MVIIILAVLGLILGSFVNALVFRLHEQSKISRKSKVKKSKVSQKDLSIIHGRSMCPNCHHKLAAKDLIPVLSWLELRGKCRYCHKPYDDTPTAEIGTALLFVASYIWWPMPFNTMGIVNFVAWLVIVVGFMALLIYDFKWLILPNRIVYPLIGLSLIIALLNITVFDGGLNMVKDLSLSLVIASGLFYGLFELSRGKWIGGGDVKLGAVIGLTVAVPGQAFLVLFTASLIGTLTVLPSLISKKIKTTSRIPFGPYLIVATILVKLFGASVIAWYRTKFLLY